MSGPLLAGNPKALAAELFRVCTWGMGGNTDHAAHKAAFYLFSELIRRLGEDHPAHRELIKRIATNPDAPEVGALQTELQLGITRLGGQRAKRIFQHFGKPLTKTRLNEIKNFGLLDRFDNGVWDEKTRKSRPCSMLELAKLLAKENEALPKKERKGPGGIGVTALAKHIENLVKKRERELTAGTWHGPITHE
jgi:hypothetical protein